MSAAATKSANFLRPPLLLLWGTVERQMGIQSMRR